MTAITTPSTHVIILFDKTRHFITAEENARLAILGNGVRVNFNGFVLNTSAISQVLPIQKFYEAYPDERPVDAKEFVAPDIETVPLDRQAERSEHALRGMLAGIAHYIDHHGTNPVIEAEYTKRKTNYKNLYKKDFIFTQDDKQRVIASFTEKDSQGNIKLPCALCLKDWKHPAYEANKAWDTVSQFV